MGAPAARAFEFSRRWVEAGHTVSVVCGIPNHPVGKVYPGYRKALLKHERIDGIDVYRAWVYVTPNAGRVRRTLNFASFAVSSVAASVRIRGVDVCIATSPQFLTGLSGVAVSRLKRIPFVFEVRDLWPDTIAAVKAFTHPRILRLLRRIERFLYRRADRIVIVSEAYRAHIERSGADPSRIRLVTNGVSIDGTSAARGARTHFNGPLKNAFLVGYFGTLGLSHNLGIMIEAAKRCRDDPGMHFVLVGEGAEKRRLKELAAGLPNVTFLDRQPRETVQAMVAEADVALVLLNPAPVFRTVIPSKMFEIMGAGTPLILGGEGESRRLLERSGAGLAIDPSSADELTEAIARFRDDAAYREAAGRSGAAFVRREFNLDDLARNYASVLEELA